MNERLKGTFKRKRKNIKLLSFCRSMDITLDIILLLILLGLLAAIVATIAGVGGGVMYVPIMAIIIGLPIDHAIDTSTFVILITSGVGFLSYLKQKRTNIKMSLIFSLFSILGALLCIGFLILFPINNEILRDLFGALLILTGVNMAYKIYSNYRRKIKEVEDPNYVLKDHDYKKDLKRGIPFFMFAGFIAYLLGIGGGVINTPALNLIFGFPIHNATALSTSIIFFTAIFNTVIKILFGSINYLIGLFLALGSVFGAFIGAKISEKMPRRYLRIFVAVLLIILGINMLL